MENAFFTIITATYNAAATLPRLLDSLAGQTCRDFELIIQDGASKDDTVANAESYRDKLPFLLLASEPDTGIYDAWNKALPRVQGEWVLFLGADDSLKSETTLEEVKEALQACPEGILLACGNLDLLSSDRTVNKTLLPRIDEAQALLRAGIMPAGHPAMFHHRSLFRADKFDAAFQIAADYEFLCRLWTPEVKTVSLGLTVTRMAAGGISQTPRAVWRTRWEVFRILRRHYPDATAFYRHTLPLAKGLLMAFVCFCLGEKRAAVFLDRFREMRGLPPAWTDIVGR